MLTPKQEKFVQNIVDGMNQSDAYRNAYSTNKMTDKQIWEEASKLAGSPKVAQRIAELRGQLISEKIMSVQKRLEWLTEAISNNDISINDKLRAIDIMNRMQGEYVQKVQAQVESEVTINIELSDD